MGNTFKMVTVVGTSPTSYEEAIASALADASATLRGLAWFEVVEMRGFDRRQAETEPAHSDRPRARRSRLARRRGGPGGGPEPGRRPSLPRSLRELPRRDGSR